MLAINTYRIDSHDECVTYNEIRTEAAIQAKLRAEAYQKAAQAKHRKDDATASHYLQEVCTKYCISHSCTVLHLQAVQELQCVQGYGETNI